MDSLIDMGKKAKDASKILRILKTETKNKLLKDSAKNLRALKENIIEKNAKDVDKAIAEGVKDSFIDRLTLNSERIEEMAKGLEEISMLKDPIGKVIKMENLPNGLIVGQKQIPIGVIGIIYEARPNVTSDAFGLCFKAGSSVILRGGKEALNTNKAVLEAFEKALKENSLPEHAVQLIENTSRETAAEFMKLNKYLDVLIPRGGAGLIKAVVENSTVPVIETGTGNCHIFVDSSANQENAIEIILNAKIQRPGVCNSCEKVLIHKDIAKEFIPKLFTILEKEKVEIRGDKLCKDLWNKVILASEDDWYEEYSDYIIAAKVVDSLEEATEWIDKYSTGHSEAILTENYTNSQKFLEAVDSACVYVNASTRFTDGFEFGFGAEIGISTQKLHARGPMGLDELTSRKFVIYGNGQIRK